MILSDQDIIAHQASGRIAIHPFEPANIQPASIDLTLDHRFMRMQDPNWAVPDVIDLKDPAITDLLRPCEPLWDRPFILYAHEFALGSTVEKVRMAQDLVGRIEGKSSLGRLGLLVHVTAGFIDPCFSGQITLELYNLTPLPILLYPGMKICQLSFNEMSSPARIPYGTGLLKSKYQNQEGPQPSRYWENFT